MSQGVVPYSKGSFASTVCFFGSVFVFLLVVRPSSIRSAVLSITGANYE